MGNTSCTRCKGTGFVSSVVENGICFGCRGKGTRVAQIAIRDAARAEQAYQDAIEPVSILVGPAITSRQAATVAFFEAFVGSDRNLWNGGEDFRELAPGWYAAEVRMNVASVLGS